MLRRIPLLLLPLILSSCATVTPTGSGSALSSLPERTYVTRAGVEFRYRADWQVLHLGYYDLGHGWSAPLGVKVKSTHVTTVNFEEPNDYGPYESQRDFNIDDFVFDGPAPTAEDYLNQAGSKSPQAERTQYATGGLAFLREKAPSEVYEGLVTVSYVASCTDGGGRNHLIVAAPWDLTLEQGHESEIRFILGTLHCSKGNFNN